MTQQIVTPVGRLVWGNPLVAREKRDDHGKVITGPDGQAKMQYQFGLAIAKTDPGIQTLYAACQAEAQAVCPNAVPPAFSWKMKDGDGIDHKGKPYNTREGYAGCMVFTFSTEFAIPVFQRQGATFAQMTQGLKTGDFVRVSATVSGHAANPKAAGSKPGLYLNPNMVEFVGYGQEIRAGADPDDVFGQPVALPPGASATPLASGPPMAAQAPIPTAHPQTHVIPAAAPAAPFPPQAAPAPQPAPAAPAAPVAPHSSFPWGGN